MDSLNKLAQLRATLARKQQQLNEFHQSKQHAGTPVSEGERVAKTVDMNLLDRYNGAFYSPKGAHYNGPSDSLVDESSLDHWLRDKTQGTAIPGTHEVMRAEGVNPDENSEAYSEIAKALNDLRTSRLRKMGGME